ARSRPHTPTRSALGCAATLGPCTMRAQLPVPIKPMRITRAIARVRARARGDPRRGRTARHGGACCQRACPLCAASPPREAYRLTVRKPAVHIEESGVLDDRAALR